MTVNEAKTKWCPMSGYANGWTVGRCLGPECMWWRTVPNWVYRVDHSDVTPVPDHEPEGYCGAIGGDA